MAGRPAGADRAGPAAVLLGIAALAVYRTTLLPGVGAWDTAEAQTVLPLLGTMHPTGFPAFVVLGWLASIVLRPLGEPAFIENLLAAGLVATAAGGTVGVARRLGVPLPVAVASGIGMARNSATMWYAQLVQSRRQDIRIIDDRTIVDDNLGAAAGAIDALLETRPVYVIRATESELHDLRQRFAIEPVGRASELYRVTGRLESSP